MKEKFISAEDKLFLKNRGLVETVIGLLKESFSMEHSRHRSTWGFFSNTFSSLVAYAFKDKKPCIKRKSEPAL